MTSNSRDRFYVRARRSHVRASACVLVALGTLAVACGIACASDAPAPALPAAKASNIRVPDLQATSSRVQIARATARAISPTDPMVAMLLPESEWRSLHQPLLVSVEVTASFTNPNRTASPVIVVNGQPIGDSSVQVKEPNRLLAILRDGSRTRRRLTIQVGWLGALEETISEPITVEVGLVGNGR